jgi:murein DD-endopeptidase MepM/ murein hydrolase activator NlpD
MSRFVELISSRHAPHFAVLALVSIGFGGCSADTSTRFSDTTFSNPFASSPSDTTGSVARGNGYQNNSQYQQPRELPQYARPRTQPIVSAPLAAPVSSVPTSGGGRGMASYAPPQQPVIEATGSTTPRSVAATPSGWSREGGTTIIVGTADTLDIISRRYNVPSAEIMKANGYNGPRMLQPGQQLVIPRRAMAQAQPPALSAAPATRTAAALPSSVHVVASGDTLMNLSRRHNITAAQLAAANHLPVTAQLKIGDKINIPGGKRATVAAATPAPQPAVPAAKPAAVAAAAPVAAKPVTVAQIEPVQKARIATETKDIPEAQSPVKAAEATNALPTFRWPVRGRVITGYGAKTNGKQNDGINVAVPEGTPVKAAEDGVVAYSGSELKGYGNLILVRHSNGYVTAYAHASELMVKRGDTIKRGQVIAKSGQTGEVGSPQLHFEIRKGSSAVDPLQFLNGA